MFPTFVKWNKNISKPFNRVLSDIYGIGSSTSHNILWQNGLQNHYRFGQLGATLEKKIVQQLTSEDISNIQRNESNIKATIRDSIDSLKKIRSYRGLRHVLKLPVRGQRTKTNARTQKSMRSTNSSHIRTSYRNKHEKVTIGTSQKLPSDSGIYQKVQKKRSRIRKFLQN